MQLLAIKETVVGLVAPSQVMTFLACSAMRHEIITHPLDAYMRKVAGYRADVVYMRAWPFSLTQLR